MKRGPLKRTTGLARSALRRKRPPAATPQERLLRERFRTAAMVREHGRCVVTARRLVAATIRTLKHEKRTLLNEVAKVQAQIDAARERKLVRCNHCGKRTAIRLLTYIQTHWYREPYSCTGGDYWSEGEGRFLCPKCGYENRLIYRPEIAKLKRHFAEVEERYDDPEKHVRKWCN